MRYFSYNDYHTEAGLDDYVATVSEEDIRATYWPYWYSKMCAKFGQQHVDQHYTFEHCLEDWQVVNWAWEVKQ